ncbi:MAG TPA: hypothetical protein VN625_09475 [Desulfuromonadaceae bacterium]|nr:hypothetical protein [Desulfuromonadaceae bacterium]
MKTSPGQWIFRFLFLNLLIAILATGCASEKKSFNKDFNEHFPIEPKYTIDNIDDHHFKVTVYQGSPSPQASLRRTIYMKEAASTVANAEGKRRGWERWDLNYLNEHDQGWMHIIVAEVVQTK